jgi:ATP-dependent DNA helicase RecG
MLVESDESTRLEAKTASQTGKSIAETISAFSNEPSLGGGYLLLGVERTSPNPPIHYRIAGVPDPDKIQSEIASQCRDMFSVPIRPQLSVHRVEGENVVVAFIPEADDHHKPVFVKSRGVHNGTFRRVGPTDQRCTEDDLAILFQLKRGSSFDETPLDGTSFSDVDPKAIESYRRARSAHPSADELLEMDDRSLLYALGASENEGISSRLTMAGLLLFGKQASLRRKLPLARIDYIRVEGAAWMADPEAGYSSIEYRGPLLTIIPKLINQVLEGIPVAFSLRQNEVHREDLPLIPKRVIREAVVNSLMHRSYQVHQPVQVIQYSNRVEIKNPGYSLIPFERLGESGSRSRNNIIPSTLHDVGLAENKGTGIPVMRKVMEKANLTVPVIETDRVKDEFRLRLLSHHFLGEPDIQWLSQFRSLGLSPMEARALIMLRETKEIDNATYRQINQTDAHTASIDLRRLRDLGLLETRGGGSAVHYVEGPNFALGPELNRQLRPETRPVVLSPSQRQMLSALRQELPEDILDSIDRLKKKASREVLSSIIRGACAARPMTVDELGLLLSRNPSHILKRILPDANLRSERINGIVYYGAGEATKRRKKQRSDAKPAIGVTVQLTDQQRQELRSLRQELPEDVLSAIDGLKKRTQPEVLQDIILEICSVRPMTSYEIGLLLSRNPEHLRNRNLRRLLFLKKLTYTYPDEPRHPKQGYATVDNQAGSR